MAGNGLENILLFDTTRADGNIQVTYNGWPLDLYKGEQAVSDMNGWGVGGKWFLISPSGDPIGQ